MKSKTLTPRQRDRIIREKHALGWSDAEIAPLLGIHRRSVCDFRRALGLPSNAFSERQRRRTAETTKNQLKRAGLTSLAEVRSQAFRKFARESGWPEELRPRSVQILNALKTHGLMTRRQLAEAIGMKWKGSRHSLTSSDPEGSHLAHLTKLGLVLQLPRISLDPQSNYFNRVHFYALTPLALSMQEQSHDSKR